MRLIISSLLIIILISCTNKNPDKKSIKLECDFDWKYFNDWKSNNYNQAIKKYNITDINFDTETIYELSDLSRVIKMILDSSKVINYQFINEYYDTINEQYKAIFKVFETNYTFETSALGDFIDFEKNFENLNDIAHKYDSNYIFGMPFYPGDQTMTLVFGDEKTLNMAIDEGFPMTLDESDLNWKNWKSIKNIEIQIDSLPNCNDMKSFFLATLNELQNENIKVPLISKNRVFIGSLHKENEIYIVIDGLHFDSAPIKITENRIKSRDDLWSVLFIYSVFKDFGTGKIKLIKKKTEEYISLKEFKDIIKTSLE